MVKLMLYSEFLIKTNNQKSLNNQKYQDNIIILN